MNRRKKPSWQKNIARERIKLLFDEADSNFAEHPERSNRYVELARKIGMKYLVRIPKNLKRKFCKHCYCYLRPGKNAVVRIDQKNKAVTITCMSCKKKMRYPYASGKSRKKRAD